jgi:hypothetical protein
MRCPESLLQEAKRLVDKTMTTARMQLVNLALILSWMLLSFPSAVLLECPADSTSAQQSRLAFSNQS